MSPVGSNVIVGPALSESFVNAFIQRLGFSKPPIPSVVMSCHVLSAPVEEINPSFALAVAVSHWFDCAVVLASNGICACEPSADLYFTITANWLLVSVIGFVVLIVLYSSCKTNPVAICVAPVKLKAPVGLTYTSTVVFPIL